MKILLIEDGSDTNANIDEYLSVDGASVDRARGGLAGLQLASTKIYDLVIFDVLLPGMYGSRICQALRLEERVEAPIIMLAARDTLEDKLLGFRSGADDYLVRPFSPAELLARIQAVLRRSRGARINVIRVGDLSYDLDTYEVTRGGAFLKINPMCLKLLKVLMKNSPGVVSREKIESEVWGDSVSCGDNLRSHIYLLRRAIDRPFTKSLIHSVAGGGYRLAELN